MRKRMSMGSSWPACAAIVLTVGSGFAPTVSAQPCPGDCDGNGSVSISELIRAVGIALGRTPIDECTAADRNQDGSISIGELIGAVNAALSGCGSPTATPTATLEPTEASATATPGGNTTATPESTVDATATLPVAQPTPTPGLPLGIFIHGDSLIQHIADESTSTTTINIFLAVDKVAEETAVITLTGPGGTVPVPLSGLSSCDSQPCASYFARSAQAPALTYVPGQSYTLRIETSIGEASLSFTAVGGVTIPTDGSQVSWQFDGDSERIRVRAQSVGFDTGIVDLTSPFAVPVSAYGAGPRTYELSGEVRRTIDSFIGAAGGSSFLITDASYIDVSPPVVGDTHTPTSTPTATFTRTPTASNTPTSTITGTIPPTPELIGEILFSSTREGGRHIFVMDPDGNNVVQITDDAGQDRDPQWNAAKTMIAFTRDSRLHLMDADGSNVRALRNSDSQFTPTFSPDGGAIVLAESFAGRTNLFAYELASEEITPLTDGQWNDASPAFTPDGALIYFTSTRDNNFFEIYRMNADGSGVERFTDNTDFEQLGEISPDGTRLAYAARSSVGTRSLSVFVMTLADRNTVQLNSVQDTSDEERPLWSPDGGHLAYRPFIDGRTKIFRMQPNGFFMTDLSRNDASEVAGDWK